VADTNLPWLPGAPGQMGIPLINVLFGQAADVPTGLITLPLLILHPFQLFVAGLLTQRLKRTRRMVDRYGKGFAAVAYHCVRNLLAAE